MAALGIGEKAAAFTLPGVDGKQHALNDYADNTATVVIFSCNHCPYVRAWEDRMIQIQADYASKGVQLLAINANDPVRYPDDNFDAMKQRATEKQFNFPYLHDETQQTARAYGAERTPEVFVVASGEIRYHGAIDDNYEVPSAVKEHFLRDALDAVLAGQTPATPETAPKGCTIKWKA